MSTPAHAGGAFLYEVGTPDVGFGSAGYAARANGPVTVLTNPAGMTRLDGVQVEVGTQLLYGALTFSPVSSTIPGNDGGNAIGLLPGGGAFATFEVAKDFRVGLGIYSNFGLTEKWESGWVGRYYATQSTLLGLTLSPGLAWNVVGGLSVGATLNVMYGYLKYTAAVQNREPPPTPDGSLGVSSTAWGFGGTFGILYEFSKATRLGATYSTPMKLDFSALPSFSGLGPAMTTIINNNNLGTNNLDLGLTVPQTVMLSFYQALGDRWAVMADVGWQNWAAFGAVQVSIATTDPKSLTTSISYLNTWHGALGAQVQLSDPWQLDFGIAFDSSMTSDSSRSLAIGLADAWRFGVGAQVAASEHWNLGLATEFLWGGSPPIVADRGPFAGTITGSYADTWIWFFAFSFTWKS